MSPAIANTNASEAVIRPSSHPNTEPEALPQIKSDPITGVSHVEVPYTEYEKEHGKPMLVDIYDLGQHWDDYEGGFSNEVNQINTLVTAKIKNGELDNTKEAVETFIKHLEKVNHLGSEQRKVVKLGVLASYAKFLIETDNLRSKLRKYGY